MSTHAELERVWKDRVEEFKASGLSQAEWCRRHGLRPKRLSYWFGKFQKADMQPEEEAQWLQVEMGGPEVPTSEQISAAHYRGAQARNLFEISKDHEKIREWWPFSGATTKRNPEHPGAAHRGTDTSPFQQARHAHYVRCSLTNLELPHSRNLC
jgi:hypothetical protein